MFTKETFFRCHTVIDTKHARSAWDKGVNAYAHDLLDALEEEFDNGYISADDLANPKLVKKALLSGADDWKVYSWGGCALIYDGDIARRLCSPSELKKTDNGTRKPNRSEEWLDVQARALYQACWRILVSCEEVGAWNS